MCREGRQQKEHILTLEANKVDATIVSNANHWAPVVRF